MRVWQVRGHSAPVAMPAHGSHGSTRIPRSQYGRLCVISNASKKVLSNLICTRGTYSACLTPKGSPLLRGPFVLKVAPVDGRRAE